MTIHVLAPNRTAYERAVPRDHRRSGNFAFLYNIDACRALEPLTPVWLPGDVDLTGRVCQKMLAALQSSSVKFYMDATADEVLLSAERFRPRS